MSGGCEVFYPYLLRIALFTKILVNNEDWICRYPSLGLCKTADRFSDVEEAFHLWWLMGTSWLNLRTSVVCKMFTIGSWTLQQKKKKDEWKWEVVYKRNSKQFSLSQAMQTSQFSVFKAMNDLSRSSRFSRFFFMTEASLWTGAECLISSHDLRSCDFNGNANQTFNKILVNLLIYDTIIIWIMAFHSYCKHGKY